MADPADTTQITVHSKRTLIQMTDIVITGANSVIDKHNDLDEDQRTRFKERFAELYRDCVHSNVMCDGKTWQEAEDDLNRTQECEPMNLDLHLQVEKQLTQIDEHLVKTTRKRKYYPRKITKDVMIEQKCLRERLEHYEPESLPTLTIQGDLLDNKGIKDSILDRNQHIAKTMSSLTKSLPNTEVQSERVLGMLEQESKEHSKTRKVISKPLQEEGVMMKSLTPLKRALEKDETPTPKPSKQRKSSKDNLAIQRIKRHSITRYNLRKTPAKEKVASH